MPRYYTKNLRSSLADRVEECLQSAPAEQLCLHEELAIMRAASAEVVQLYDDALAIAENENLPEQKRESARQVAAQTAPLMASQLKQVADLCKIATNVDAMQSDKLTVHSLHYIVDQIIVTSHDVLHKSGVTEAVILELADRIKNDVRLPTDDFAQGTDLVPEVIAMDMTVPGPPRGGNGNGNGHSHNGNGNGKHNGSSSSSN